MANQDRIFLEIVTPERQVFRDHVERFSVPALMGSTGVLYNHAPLVTVLTPGLITYEKDGVSACLAVGRGFLEVRDNEAEILVASAELPEEIDRERAEKAAARAQERLRDSSDSVDRKRAEEALDRAKARLKASATLQKG